MKNAELKVISFNENDVIATSLCMSTETHYRINSVDNNEGVYDIGFTTYLLTGDVMKTDGYYSSTLDDFDSSVGITKDNCQDSSWLGKWFVLSGEKFVFCDLDHYKTQLNAE